MIYECGLVLFQNLLIVQWCVVNLQYVNDPAPNKYVKLYDNIQIKIRKEQNVSNHAKGGK